MCRRWRSQTSHRRSIRRSPSLILSSASGGRDPDIPSGALSRSDRFVIFRHHGDFIVVTYLRKKRLIHKVIVVRVSPPTLSGVGWQTQTVRKCVRYAARRVSAVLAAILLIAAALTATATSTSAESVSTGYKNDGVSDLIWAAEHFGYSGPGEMQKAGVSAIRFILGVAGGTEKECDLGLADSLDPTGPYVYESTWSDEELDALEWVVDHYCITKEQAQLYGGTLFTFFAGLDAAKNGTSAVRRATTTSTVAPTTTTTTSTVAPTTTMGVCWSCAYG